METEEKGGTTTTMQRATLGGVREESAVVYTENKGTSMAATEMESRHKRLVIVCTAGPATLSWRAWRRTLGATRVKHPRPLLNTVTTVAAPAMASPLSGSLAYCSRTQLITVDCTRRR
jgi:hypothetical protein